VQPSWLVVPAKYSVKGSRCCRVSLHHNLAGHFRVDRAVVGIRSRLVKLVGELFVRIPHLDLKTPSVLTTVWGISSRFVQVTVAPTGTVSVCGPKLKLSIFTSAFAVEGCSFALTLDDPAKSSNAIIIGTAKTATRIFLFVIFLFLFSS